MYYQKCKFCGGDMVVEYLSQYGEIHKINRNGSVCKKRIQKKEYGGVGADPLFYCLVCKRIGKTQGR